MKNKADALALLIAGALVVIYFAWVLPRLEMLPTSPIITVLYWIVIAVLIAPPIARICGEKVAGQLFYPDKGRVMKECSRARSLAARGKFEQAVEEYRRALEKEPDNIRLRMDIAEIYSREMKDFRQAVAELEECLKIHLSEIQGASVLNRIADIYETDLRDPEAAVEALGRIARKWPLTVSAERAEQRIEGIQKAEGRRD
jgi:tetratricopeptide (TPR) repeat protein